MSEAELIQGLKNKDESVFSYLVEQHKNKIYNIVLNIVLDEEEADDCTQEVFISVYEGIGSFKGGSALSTWMYKIAVRKGLDHVRKKNTRKRLQQWLPWWMADEKKSASTEFHHPGVIAENKEKAAILFKAIERLPERQKVAFTLIKVQSLSYDEVSGILNMNIKAIESLVSRAKDNLEKQLRILRSEL